MRIIFASLAIMWDLLLPTLAAWSQSKPETPPYTLQILRTSTSPPKLTLDASQAPAAEVLRALSKESRIEVLVADSLTVPVTAHLVDRSPEAVILHVGQMKGVRIRAVRVPSSLDISRLTAEKLGAIIDGMSELGFAAAVVPPIPKQQADNQPRPIAPPVTLLTDAATAARLSTTDKDFKVIWVALPETSAEQKPKSETLGELACLNQRIAELVLKMTPEERQAYLQMQIEQFRQLPLPLQRRTLLDGMSMLLGLTPKEQGDLMAGMFREMSQEQKKAFLNLGTLFMQNVTPEEIP
ncbi:MAG: hypothetical protein ACUVTZ_11885 [Armatimonadota bacterium]